MRNLFIIFLFPLLIKSQVGIVDFWKNKIDHQTKDVYAGMLSATAIQIGVWHIVPKNKPWRQGITIASGPAIIIPAAIKLERQITGKIDVSWGALWAGFDCVVYFPIRDQRREKIEQQKKKFNRYKFGGNF